MARDASNRGANRPPRERRRYAYREGAASGRYLRSDRTVMQRGFLEDGRRPRSVDQTNVYDGILPHEPGTFGHF